VVETIIVTAANCELTLSDPTAVTALTKIRLGRSPETVRSCLPEVVHPCVAGRRTVFGVETVNGRA
jgi:hypothetical protein